MKQIRKNGGGDHHALAILSRRDAEIGTTRLRASLDPLSRSALILIGLSVAAAHLFSIACKRFDSSTSLRGFRQELNLPKIQ
jgi:hypothetical protein